MHITVLDRAGQHFMIERRPARELTYNDPLVYWTGVGLTSGAVIHSSQAQGRCPGWYFAIEGFGGQPIDPGQYAARQIA